MRHATLNPPRLYSFVVCTAAMFIVFSSLRTAAGQGTRAAGRANGARQATPKDDACFACHRDLVEQYPLTAHSRTSQLASANSILGPMTDGRQNLTIRSPQASGDGTSLAFTMGQDGDHFFQRAISGFPGQMNEQHGFMDEVIGSGVRGQSYLEWRGDQLYEMPLSYWRDGDRWINSPGFPDGSAEFSRPVTARCLECHATFVQAKSMNDTDNRFVRTTLDHGIGCTRCHGPGAAHVAAERKGAEKGLTRAASRQIRNPARFSRQQQVDLCALCHGGRREQLQPAFSYTAGDSLDDFLEEPRSSGATPDVHGNQVGLLKLSKCYLNSPQMTCSTCHQVHAPEKEVSVYSSRCVTCHKPEACGMFAKAGTRIANDCIRCHMPMQLTNSIASETAGEAIRTKIRTHLIGVYPEYSSLENIDGVPVPAPAPHP